MAVLWPATRCAKSPDRYKFPQESRQVSISLYTCYNKSRKSRESRSERIASIADIRFSIHPRARESKFTLSRDSRRAVILSARHEITEDDISANLLEAPSEATVYRLKGIGTKGVGDEKIDSQVYILLRKCLWKDGAAIRMKRRTAAMAAAIDDRQQAIIVLCIHFVSRLAFVMQVELPRCRCRLAVAAAAVAADL